jgi:uncharacterized protein (TIGR02271 family)
MNPRKRPTESDLDETREQNAAPNADTARLQRVEERLVADVETFQSGGVRLTKRVVEEPESLEVELRHDEIDFERRPADRPLQPGEEPVANRGDETVVLVVEERLEVRKVAWVVEEIHLRRRLVSDSQEVTDTVRKERWEISTEGEVELKHRHESTRDIVASHHEIQTPKEGIDMSTHATQIQTGWDVYGSDDEKIGDVSGVAHDHFIIEKGFIFTEDVYVPMSAIASVGDERVYLTYTKDQVENQQWSSPPAAGSDAYESDRGIEREHAARGTDRDTIERARNA